MLAGNPKYSLSVVSHASSMEASAAGREQRPNLPPFFVPNEALQISCHRPPNHLPRYPFFPETLIRFTTPFSCLPVCSLGTRKIVRMKWGKQEVKEEKGKQGRFCRAEEQIKRSQQEKNKANVTRSQSPHRSTMICRMPPRLNEESSSPHHREQEEI
ncbi:hypothetical protein B0T17DRAFT_84476 [Bombardia bombarda]|uniref:Uncharacterized protein n=1 Tax=Bombardia bombarda TaxID=252184 RepID=A0AA40CFP3_9PEZI|nr:hypothetical protein B0T17DRAFT_84476 [Bombardia bombarda]